MNTIINLKFVENYKVENRKKIEKYLSKTGKNGWRTCIDLHQTLTGGKWMQTHARINSSQIH